MRTLTNEQFQTLLHDPVYHRFEMEKTDTGFEYIGKDILIIEGKELNVEADVYLFLDNDWEIKGLKSRNIDVYIARIIDDECNEYQFTSEQEPIFEKHFRKHINVSNLILSEVSFV